MNIGLGVLHAFIDKVSEAGASLEAERDSSWKKPFRTESSCFRLSLLPVEIPQQYHARQTVFD